MGGENSQLDFLDVIAIVSFCLQMQNQSKLFSLHDIQEDNNRIAGEIHGHLEAQDEKINRIMEVLGLEG